MRGRYKSVLAVLVCLVSGAYAQAAPDTSSQVGMVVIGLCMPSNAADALQHWTMSTRSALARVASAPALGLAKLAVQNRPMSDCPDVQQTACQSKSGAVLCNANKLARILLSEAFVAASYAVQHDPQAKRKTEMLDVAEALTLADAVLAGNQESTTRAIKSISSEGGVPLADLVAMILAVRNINDYDITPNAPLPSNATAVLSYLIYEAASNYTLAFLVGHELAHAYGRCIVDEPSASEVSGAFVKFVSMQTGGNILCQNPVYADEIKADRCALRIVQQTDDAMIEAKSRAKAPLLLEFLSVSRRLAIDTVVYFFLVGYEASAEESIRLRVAPHVLSSVLHSGTGYMYGALRAILFVETVKTRESAHTEFVRFCGNAARDLVMLLNYAMVQCEPSNGGGKMSVRQSALVEPFGEYVPRGVIKSWQTGLWKDGGASDSFSCEQQRTK